jgi:DMSO/TMAO reductase YedYZ molybdopterin-dependent catalytic subunit
MKEIIISEKQVRRRNIFAFAFFILAFAAGILAWKALRREPQADNIPVTLRQGLMANERVFGGLFNRNRLVPTYLKSQAVSKVRVNGDLGLKDASFDPATWRLQVIRKGGDTAFFTLADLKKLPKTEVVFDFKCIEGWSQKTWWGGVKFSDFARQFHLDEETNMSYVGLSTPDKAYYVGIDMPSILQPQTLLCYEMNGKPLPMNQGFPLRLIIPVKYGIKHLKRIGTIYFSNQRPPDYWAEQGYDYYSGH